MEHKKMIALTFDDGPSDLTERLVSILLENGASATLFVVGERIDEHNAALCLAASSGLEIGNHTFSHRPMTYLTDDEIKAEISSTAEMIAAATGSSTLLVRPPYGDLDDRVSAIGRDMGVTFIGWAVDTSDWSTDNADSTCRAILENACDGDIILCHETYSSTLDAVQKAIPALKAQGFELVTVSQLLGSSPIAGKLYRKAE